MKPARLIFLICLLSAALPITPAQAQRQAPILYRFLNLAFEVGANVDLYLDREAEFFEVEPETLTGEKFIGQAGEHEFQLYIEQANIEAAAALAELTLEVEEGDTFLLIAYEQDGKVTLMAHRYDFSPVRANHARLEVIQLALDIPAVSVLGQNNDLLVQEAKAGEVTTVEIPGGVYQASLRDPASSKIAETTLNADSGNLATLVVYADDRVKTRQLNFPLAIEGVFRFVHAGRIAPPLDVYFGEELVFSEVAYKQGTAYKSLPQGNYTVSLVEAGQPLADTTPLWTGRVSLGTTPLTGVALGEVTLRLVTYQDDLQLIPAERARVRFINAALNLPLLTVYTDGSEPLIGGLEYILGSPNLNVEVGERPLIFKETEGAELVTLEAFQFEPNYFYTFIVVGNALVEDSVEVLRLGYQGGS